MNPSQVPSEPPVASEDFQLSLPPGLHAKLQEAAELKRCTVEDFVRRVASDEADRTLLTGRTSLQQWLADVPVGKPQPRRPLTRRELEVLMHIASGATITDVAGKLGIRWFTVNDHIKSIYRKLGVNSRAAAVLKAVKMGLVA